MPNIFVKPQPLENTVASQKPPIEQVASSSNSINHPSKEQKSTAGSGYSSANIKILEAKVDLI